MENYFFGGRFVLYEISLRLKSGEHFVLRIIFTQQLKKTVVYTGYTHDPTSSLYRIDGDNYSGMGMYIPNSFTTPKYLLWNNYFKSSIAWYHASGWAETESIWGN
ncbi:hypothetical protein PL671_06240 [Phocaeicola vulgatus]|uniref:hypothetical protein n=1 Tax=Phocaeicola vulgatus TaxID=821 RepID=UPI001E49AFBB|nr:hypothetical protein [Phocaeicola vulgatus]MDB0776278.1 hypothetical protein [Phocaeicola vulgatus]MDB0784763.1 hypothetical protein [Phocaeicola vulgatus]MDB0817205.1 hypothetical protein [Phocaeicola vulgatus]MDB0829925.1 hypothetical protein [Phocaeicola vulgatus]MDB0836357.1 hypothetical protein [Phocaeicola vulgatus]